MTKAEFREKWGPGWAALIASPMWQDAITTVESEIGMFQLAGMTDEEIERHGHLKLKAMQAHIRLESTLVSLAEKPFEFANLTEEYPDPVAEEHALANPTPAPKTRKKKNP